MERHKKVDVCPMQEWLSRYGYTHVWLTEHLEPGPSGKPIAANHVFMWFTRRKRPSLQRVREMAALTNGAVTVGELNAFFEKEGVILRRRAA